MDLVTAIKETVSDVAIRNLAGHLGEDINGTKLGLDLGLGTFLAGVIKFSSTDKTGKGLLGVLNDGGHTGDILNNFEVFSGKPEKSKLLETIGENIVNHFLKDKREGVITKVAAHAGIKDSSSATLLNLAAPLVLGALGKMAREENLSGQELKAFLLEATPAVSAAIPSSLVHAFNLPRYRPEKNTSHSNAVKQLNRDASRKNWSMLLPWLLLLLLGVLIWYFSRPKEQPEKTFEPESPLSEIILPLDSTERIPDTVQTPAAVSPLPEPPHREEDKQEPVADQGEDPVEPDATPAGLTAVPASAFAPNSAEIVDENELSALRTALEQSRRKLVLTPLSRSGAVGVDRAYAIRDYLLDRGTELSRVEVTAPARGGNPSGVAWKINN